MDNETREKISNEIINVFAKYKDNGVTLFDVYGILQTTENTIVRVAEMDFDNKRNIISG